MKICYVMPSFMCCGGNRIVVEHMNRLAKRGHVMYVTAFQPKLYKLDWIKLHKNVKVIEKFMETKEIPLDAIVATYFETVYHINQLNLPKKVKKFYFAQQIESRFFHDEYSKMRAEFTYYQKDFTIFTEAAWLRNEFLLKYAKNVYYIPNKQQMPSNLPTRLTKASKKRGPIILVEGDIRSSNKGVHDAIRVLRNLPYEKWLLTNAQPTDLPFEFHLMFEQRFFAQTWANSLNIIRSADVLVKPSKFEGSPTPHMEAMKLGTLVVTSDCTGVDEYCIPDYNCIQYELGSDSKMRQAIMRAAEDKNHSHTIRINASKYASKHFKWKESIDKLENMFKKECERHGKEKN